MAELKKNQMNQILFTMVKTDGVSIKSNIAAGSDITRYYYGVAHGDSAAAGSGAISKIPSHVYSGIWRQTLKAAECNFDYALYNFKATSCLDQNMVFQLVTNDDSDFYSLFISRVPALVATNSDVGSKLLQLKSDLTSQLAAMGLETSSDMASKLTQFKSDITSLFTTDASDIVSALAAAGLVTASDMASKLDPIHSSLSNVHSLVQYYGAGISDSLSGFYSDINYDIAATRAVVDFINDELGSVKTYTVGNSVILSDLRSLFTNHLSDLSNLHSHIAFWGTGNSASISDIASGVTKLTSRVTTQTASKSMLSQLAAEFYSRVPSTIGTASALDALYASLNSDLHSSISGLSSDLQSVFSADLSDMASAVWAEPYATAAGAGSYGSAFRVAYSTISNLDSALSNAYSDLRSQIAAIDITIGASEVSDIVSAILGGGVATASSLSDLASLFASRVTGVVATYDQVDATDNKVDALQVSVSDIGSDLNVANSRILVIQSTVSDLYNDGVALNTATMNTIDSKIDAVTATITTSDVSNIASAVWAIPIADKTVTITASDMSDLRSAIVNVQSHASNVHSMLDFLNTKFSSRIGKSVATASALTSFASNINSRVPKIVASASALSDFQSDLASDLVEYFSDIQSAITAVTSDINSGIDQAVSDLTSRIVAITSDLNSAIDQALSDINSGLDNITVTIGESDISNIVSGIIGGGLASASAVSDIYSLLGSFDSNFQSRVPKIAASASQLTATDTYLATMSSVQSNIYSLLTSRVTEIVATAATLSNVHSALSDFQSDFQSRVPKAVATASALTAGVTLTASSIDAIWDEATSSHVTQGTFGELFQGVRANTAQTAAAGTITLDASASSTNDFYNGCLIKIVAGTGAGQRRWITDYVGSTKVATIDSNWVTTPDGTSKFVIL